MKVSTFPVPGILGRSVGLSIQDDGAMVNVTLTKKEALRLMEQLRLLVQAAEQEATDD